MTALHTLLLFALACATVPGLLLALSIWAGPKKSTPEKQVPYECGFPPAQAEAAPFPIKFYLVAIIFVIFDVEVAFLFPWAVLIRELGWPGFVVGTVFLGYLTLGLVYAAKKGALDWH